MKTEEIDRQIGMPDIDQEWMRFKQQHIERPSIAPRTSIWRNRAAAITVCGLLGLCAVASTSLYLYNTLTIETEEVAAAEHERAIIQTAQTHIESNTSDTAVIRSYLKAENETFVFDNVEMQQIAHCLQEHYGIEVTFANDEVRHLRLYVTFSQKKSLQEVVELLNHLQVVQLRLNDNRLIIE